MSAPAAVGADARRGPRPPRRSTVLVVLVVLATLAVVALGTTAVTREAPLDPDNPDGAGAQALARVLVDEGVDVEVVRDADALTDALSPDAGPAPATVLVTSPDDLGASTARELREAARGSRLVVVAPGLATLDVLGVDALPLPGGSLGPLAAGCEGDAPALDDLELEVAVADVYPLPGCFPTPDGTVLADAGDGLWLLGSEDPLSNAGVLEADDAAIALRLLGAGERLVWYVPDPADVVAGDAVGLTTLLPPWLVPSLWMLLAASLAAIAWRARRFGPLATEPLPVSVKASETTRSRGRLYHRARDRGHAAAALRSAARRRIAGRLGAPALPLPGGHDPLATDVARRTGRRPEEVDAVLSPDGPVPASDADLITLASRLDELDREVRRS